MNTNFASEEKLYRAVLPLEMYWRSDGTISSAAFHDKNGLSDFRDDSDVVSDMKARGLSGGIIFVTAEDCSEIEAIVLYKPIENNQYHSEIHRNETVAVLSKGQMKRLARKSIIVCK